MRQRVQVIESGEVNAARKAARWEFMELLYNMFPDPEDKERRRIEAMVDDWWPMEDRDG